MIKKANLLILGLLFITFVSQAQQGVIKGRVFDAKNNENLPFVNIGILGTTNGTSTDDNGNFEIGNLKPGYYNVQVTYIGYETNTIYELQVFNSKPTIVNFAMIEMAQTLDEVVIKPKLFSRPKETPISIKSMGVAEIKRSPGGFGDISKVVQTMPGVASTPASGRNDMIIRGGGPSENKYYVDGFPVNTINHFTTQGASGGVWGIIDANQLKQLNLISGAFPAHSSDALSSVFDIKLKEGSFDKFGGQLNIGSLTRGINGNGHIGDKTSFLFGVRQTNFDLLLAKEPIIPVITDVIAKTVTTLNDKNKVELFAMYADDKLEINTDAEKNDLNLFILSGTPEIKIKTYTFGAKWMKYWDNGSSNLIVSQNKLDNQVDKYQDHDTSKLKLIDYNSTETETKINVTNNFVFDAFRLGFGANYELAKYTIDNHFYWANNTGVHENLDASELDITKYGLYLNASKTFLNDKLSIALGTRIDGNNYSDEFSNPFKQFSPRTSISYQVNDKLSINANTGIYYQNPAYSSFGYRENDVLINKENKITPIKSTHYIAGFDYNTNINSQITVEGFYKKYDNYPMSVVNQTSLANVGTGFGIFGSEALTPTTKGKSLGVEFMYQQKIYKSLYGMLSYTFVNSEFTNANDKYISSAWDYGNILSATLGKRFKHNWELGVKWVYYGGSPYTPYDNDASALISNWDVSNGGIRDVSKLNTERTKSYHQLDIRIDKKFYFKKWNLNFYADVQNVYNYSGGVPPYLILDRDANFNPQVSPSKPNSYLLKEEEFKGSGIIPNVGVIIEL